MIKITIQPRYETINSKTEIERLAHSIVNARQNIDGVIQKKYNVTIPVAISESLSYSWGDPFADPKLLKDNLEELARVATEIANRIVIE